MYLTFHLCFLLMFSDCTSLILLQQKILLIVSKKSFVSLKFNVETSNVQIMKTHYKDDKYPISNCLMTIKISQTLR